MADAPGAEPVEQVADAAGADDENAALVAELEAEQGGKPAVKPVKKPAVKPTPAKDEPAAEEPDEGAEVEAGDEPADADAEDSETDEDDELDEDEDDEESDDETEDDELDDEASKDPAIKKRLDAVRRTAERQRQRLEQERGELERQRTAFQGETKQLRADVDRFRALAARAKIDPAAVLEMLGLTPDDMEYAGSLCYARGKTAAADPKYRQAAEKAIRDRELAEAAAANAKEIADLKAKLDGKDSQAAVERELDAYFSRVFRKATDATPITSRLIAKRPNAARAELAVTAHQLAEKLGRMPKVAELLAAHEKREVRALKLRGIKPPTPGAGKPVATPAAAAPAGKAPVKPASKTAKPAKAAEADDDLAIPTTADLVKELQAAQRN